MSRVNDIITVKSCANDQSQHRTHTPDAVLRSTTRSTYGNRAFIVTCPCSCRRTQYTKVSPQLLEHQVRATSRVKDGQPAGPPESVEPYKLRGLRCRACLG